MSTAHRPTARGLANRAGLFGASIVLAVLLVVGFRPPDDATGAAGTSTSGSGSGTGTSSRSTGTTSGSTTSGSKTTTPTATGSTAGTSASGTKTVTGALEQTRYGPVQVEITISAGKIVAVTALELPSGGRSGSISMYAGPILADEAVAAQSASIDTVSGATYTSRGYAASLQAALDQTGL